MATENHIKLQDASLHESNGEIVAHGWLDIESLDLLKVDDYQREVLAATGKSKTQLQRALEKGARLPDVMLGMRGQEYKSYGDTMTLVNKVYIVDGLQRVFALKQFAERFPEKAKNVLIGAEIRFDTTRSKEMELFRALNMFRIPVSPNVNLRNVRDKHPGVLTLYGLSVSDASSPIYGRVTWTQRMGRGELLTALMTCKVARAIHLGTGARAKKGSVIKTAADTSSRNFPTALDAIVDKIGLKTYRSNIITFFNLVDECFGFSKIEYREASVQTKGNFLVALCTLLAKHSNFWEGNNLVVNAADKKRLSAFPLQDPEIARLSAAGNMAIGILINLMATHFNKGRTRNRLQPRQNG